MSIELLNLLRAVPQLSFKLSAHAEATLAKDGVSPGQRALMEDIAAGRADTTASLAKKRPVSKQYVQRLVTELVEDGYLRQKIDQEDSRVKRLSVTSRGKNALARWQAVDLQKLTQLDGIFSQDEIKKAYYVISELNEILATNSEETHMR